MFQTNVVFMFCALENMFGDHETMLIMSETVSEVIFGHVWWFLKIAFWSWNAFNLFVLKKRPLKHHPNELYSQNENFLNVFQVFVQVLSTGPLKKHA